MKSSHDMKVINSLSSGNIKNLSREAKFHNL